MADEDIESFGPAMLALDERQRKFVRNFIAQGKRGEPNNNKAARAAGYSAKSYGAIRVAGHRLSHNPRIQAAILEESRKDVNIAAAIIASPVVISIALDEKLKSADRLRACEMLYNRGGMPAMTEHKVTVEHIDDTRMLEFANRLATELGVDRGKLIGFNAGGGKVIEGEKVDG